LSYPDKVFKGKVDKIFNVIDPETKAMEVRINLHNHDYLLKPEMRASITLSSVDSATLMPAIPTKALIFDKSQNFVLVFKDRKHIETRPVQLFSTVGNTAYLKSGLKEGEKVIDSNQLLIYDALND
jgi:cobalt-zinc-cadmium efflux system membrane fusion protein